MSPVSKVVQCEDEAEVIGKLCALVKEAADEAIRSRGVFTIGLSGGSLAKYLATGLPSVSTDWSKWRVFFCDERHVPLSHQDSTYRVYKEGLLSKVPLSEHHVYKANSQVTVAQAAEEYVGQLRSVFGETADWPVFDLLMLGMGPDGHTCSLFPGHSLLDEETLWVAPISDSPKPPPSRITMTYPLLNRARQSVFAACGEGKADMVSRVLQGTDDPPLPAARVRSAQVTWFVDRGAGRLLSSL